MTRTQSGFHGSWRAISTTGILSELCVCVHVCVCMCVCAMCHVQPAYVPVPRLQLVQWQVCVYP